MKYHFIIFFICLVTNAYSYQSAHVIPLSEYEGETYVILGLNKKGLLSTFGGLKNKGEDNPLITAARETEEEALGVLGDQDKVLENLLYAIGVVEVSKGNPTYILPPQEYGEIVNKFRKRRFSGRKLSRSQKEMVKLVPVFLQDLIDYAELYSNKEVLRLKASDGKIYKVRKAADQAIIQAIKCCYLSVP